MQDADDVFLPAEMHSVPLRVLEAYVKERVVRFTSEPTFHRHLGVPATVVDSAVRATLVEQAARASAQQTSGRFLQLVFRHDCQSQGCLEHGCELCAQNPSRRCADNFSGKYLSGDALSARCGAPIRLEVIDRMTGEAINDDALANIQVELCVLDGRMYDDTAGNGAAALDQACLLQNNSGRPLLVPGKGAEGARHSSSMSVLLAMTDGRVPLPDISITGSSEAILQGQKPPFRLLARAVSTQDGSRVAHIRPAVSEPFVVATPRVRTAVKADIPHLDDHVSKLHAVGAQTQQKLQNVSEACEQAGVFGVQLPHNTVTTVGEFRMLVDAAERDRALCDTLKRVLKLSKGWEAARDHARSAVGTDNRLRRWLPPGASAGLLYKCLLGNIDLTAPLGILQSSRDGTHGMMECTLTHAQSDSQADQAAQLAEAAARCWWQPGHPGFAIAPLDSERFITSLAGGGGPFAVPPGSPLLATAAATSEAKLRLPARSPLVSPEGTPSHTPMHTPPISPRGGPSPEFVAGAEQLQQEFAMRRAAVAQQQQQAAAAAAHQGQPFNPQDQQRHAAAVQARAAQQAQAGGPLALGRHSMDAMSFEDAQRALTLSTLSMPDRIAFMQAEIERSAQRQQQPSGAQQQQPLYTAEQQQQLLNARHASGMGGPNDLGGPVGGPGVARAWNFAGQAHAAAPGGEGGFNLASVGRQSAPAQTFANYLAGSTAPEMQFQQGGYTARGGGPGATVAAAAGAQRRGGRAAGAGVGGRHAPPPDRLLREWPRGFWGASGLQPAVAQRAGVGAGKFWRGGTARAVPPGGL